MVWHKLSMAIDNLRQLFQTNNNKYNKYNNSYKNN